MDPLTKYAALITAISALRHLDASGSLADAAAADVSEAIVSLEREAARTSEAIDAECDEPDVTPDLDPMTWERRAA